MNNINIDSHAHMIPPSFLKMIKEDKLKGIKIIEDDKSRKKSIVFSDGSKHPFSEVFTSIEKRLELMNSYQCDKQVVSITPRFFFYDFPLDLAIHTNESFNNDIAALSKEYPDRFIGMGSVPLQDTNSAITELERMNRNLGLKAIQIGTFVNGYNLSDERFIDFFRKAEELNIFVFIHPLIKNDDLLVKNYHLSNLVGNPTQTTIAISNLIFSGLFDIVPNIKIGLAHGGGFLPYQLGRLEHGYEVRQDTKSKAKKSPREYIKKNIYFDALTHSKEALEFLVKLTGSEKVMFGTDYPYDMAEYDQIDNINQLWVHGFNNSGSSNRDLSR